MNPRWKERQNPHSLEAKFLFQDYETLRVFLDRAADSSEKLEVHPNISFGRDYASVLIYPVNDALEDAEYSLAESLDRFYEESDGRLEE
ncbi:MAG TPA: hypothetical protein VJ961_02715 [Mariprofundaceae bacterium]|nr:hypothetical protein [Mariprofundaceae bacterium]